VLINVKNIGLLALQTDYLAPSEIGARMKMQENTFNNGEISGLIHCPAQSRKIFTVLHV